MTERLPDELRELIAAERATPPLTDDAAARIAARLSGTLALPLPPPDLGATSGAVAAAPGTAAVAATTWTAARLAPIAIAFVIGSASGAAITASVLHERPLAVPAEERPAAPAPPRLPSAPPVAETGPAPAPMQPDDGVTAPGLEPPSVSTRVGKASSVQAAPAHDATDLELRAERELLELARRAIAQGHAADALEALESHDRRFPRGRLSEERDSLRVPALVMLGDRAQGLRRAEQFRARHPTSLFLPVVERALQSAEPVQNP